MTHPLTADTLTAEHIAVMARCAAFAIDPTTDPAPDWVAYIGDRLVQIGLALQSQARTTVVVGRAA